MSRAVIIISGKTLICPGLSSLCPGQTLLCLGLSSLYSGQTLLCIGLPSLYPGQTLLCPRMSSFCAEQAACYGETSMTSHFTVYMAY